MRRKNTKMKPLRSHTTPRQLGLWVQLKGKKSDIKELAFKFGSVNCMAPDGRRNNKTMWRVVWTQLRRPVSQKWGQNINPCKENKRAVHQPPKSETRTESSPRHLKLGKTERKVWLPRKMLESSEPTSSWKFTSHLKVPVLSCPVPFPPPLLFPITEEWELIGWWRVLALTPPAEGTSYSVETTSENLVLVVSHPFLQKRNSLFFLFGHTLAQQGFRVKTTLLKKNLEWKATQLSSPRTKTEKHWQDPRDSIHTAPSGTESRVLTTLSLDRVLSSWRHFSLITCGVSGRLASPRSLWVVKAMRVVSFF